MATFRLPARVIFAGGGAAAIAAAPMLAVFAGSAPAPRILADCPGDINMSIIAEGVPVQPDCAAPVAPGSPAGAPSQELLTACSNIPGCLSNAFYGPGHVQVPRRDTRVRQSQ